MVKVDVTKDYYAALGVGPNADTDEIKKKFRKLALKYHPDRNPGKEVEFNAKFQAIQAAHEVLVDPQQRLKYDTDRLRAGYGKLYSPRPSASARPPPTPYQTQPRRPTPSQAYKQGYQTSGSYQPPPSAGAQKYSSYAKAQAQNWDKAYREAHTRADAFRGFQDMKNNSGGTAGGWSNIDPRTGRPTGAQGQRPQSAYDSYFTPPRPFQPGPRRSQTTKKKNGFAPGNPDGDDEPMATNTSAYVNVARGERAQASYPQPTFEPASAPTAKRPERTATANGQPNLERTSSKYATTGGEKTYFSAAGLWRSASTRDPPSQDSDSRSRTNPPSPTSSQPSHGRHHSASPKMRPNRDRTFSSSSTESSGLSDVDVPWRPKARPRSRKFANAAKSSGWENYNSGEDFMVFATRGDSWLLNNENHRHGTTAQAQPIRSKWNLNWGANTQSSQGHNSESTTFTKNRPVHEQATSGTGPTFTSSSHPQPNNLPKQHNDTNGPKDKAGLNNSNIFDTSTLKATLEKNQGSLNGKSKSKSHENIDVGFSAADWNVKFESGANIFNPTPSNNAQAQKPKTERGRTTSRPRSASSAQPTSAFKPPAQPAPGAAPFQGTQPSQPIPTFTGTPFSANNWAELLRDNLWTKPHNEPQQKDKVDTQRQKSPKKQPKAPSKRTNVPKPASVSTEADEAAKTYKTGDTDNVKQGGNVDGEAMDIDGGAPAPRNEKRTTADKTTPTGSGTATPTTNKKPKAEPKSHLFNLKKLGLVSPFAPNNTGINDLNDLSNTLPFESRAENSSGARINIRPRDLALPKPPKTPAPPKLITEPSPAGEKPLAVLPQAAWDCYIAEMSAYFHEWNVFNRSMLGHFNARQATVDTGLAPKWMSSVGNSGKLNIDRDADLSPSQQGGAGNDNTSTGTAGAFVDDEELVAGSAKGGFNAYLRGVEEDFVVRQHWEVACERHRECMLTLGRVRQWIRNGGKIRPFARSSG